MLFPFFVVQQGLFAQTLLQGLPGHGHRALRGDFSVQYSHLQSVQRRAGIPVGEGGDYRQQRWVHVDPGTAEAASVGQRPGQQPHQILLGQFFQHKHFAPGEQSGIDFKRGVLRGGADQCDAAPLHIGQKGVLLGFVKAVNLVHEYQGADTIGPVFLGLVHELFDFFDAAGHGAEVHEVGAGAVGDDTGQSGFAHSRRPPEDHGRDLIPFQKLAQNFAGAQEMPLSHVFFQSGRAAGHGSGAGRAVLSGITAGIHVKQ